MKSKAWNACVSAPMHFTVACVEDIPIELCSKLPNYFIVIFFFLIVDQKVGANYRVEL